MYFRIITKNKIEKLFPKKFKSGSIHPGLWTAIPGFSFKGLLKPTKPPPALPGVVYINLGLLLNPSLI
jgi:hypothetical protein